VFSHAQSNDYPEHDTDGGADAHRDCDPVTVSVAFVDPERQ